MRKASGRDWAAYLDTAMRGASLTQAELARRTGLAESMVSRWLRGLNQPDVPNLRRVRPVLGVPMLELLVAAGHLTQDEAQLRDAPEPPAPVRVGIETDGLTTEQVRQVEGYAAFLRAQTAKAQARVEEEALLRARKAHAAARAREDVFLRAAGVPPEDGGAPTEPLPRAQTAELEAWVQEDSERQDEAEPLRYAAYGGARLSREQQERAREQARRAREEGDRTGQRVVYLDDQESSSE